MAAWSGPVAKIRNDDPYRAFDLHRTIRSDQPQVIPEGETALCPVVIEVGPESGRLSDLRSNLDRLHKFVKPKTDSEGGREFFASSYENEHFDRITAGVEKLWKENSEATFGEELKYARFYVIYGPERALFGKDQTFPGDLPFQARFIGSPVRQERSLAKETRGQAGFRRDFSTTLAIIDDSIAFLNQAFEKEGSSLFQEIWFQERIRSLDGLQSGGNRIDRDGIAELLRERGTRSEQEIYESDVWTKNGLGTFRPIDHTSGFHQPLAFPDSHGTHVAATAVAAFIETIEAPDGSANGLGLFGVTLPVDVTQDTSGGSIGTHLIEAIFQVMRWNDLLNPALADEADPSGFVPLVINCSYGFVAGKKDGTDLLPELIGEILASRNASGQPTALVVPMGNSHATRAIGKRTLKASEAEVFDWVLEPDDRTPSFLEILVVSPDKRPGSKLRLMLESPFGHEPVTFNMDGDALHNRQVLFSDTGALIGEWSEWEVKENDTRSLRGVLCLAPTQSHEDQDATVPPGRWAITATNTSQHEVELWAMAQRDDTPGTYPAFGRQSYLDHHGAHEFGSEAEYPMALSANYDQLSAHPHNSFLTHEGTHSVLATIASCYCYIAAAGVGEFGDNPNATNEQKKRPTRPSAYAAAGRAEYYPDFTELSDRSVAFPGIYGASTYSGGETIMAGSSVAAPQLAGFLAADLSWIGECQDDMMDEQDLPDPPEKTRRFGVVRP